MSRATLVLLIATMSLGLSGCATPAKSPDVAAGLPGITPYYAQLARPHHRAVRKPVQDQHAYALRMIKQRADALLADAQTWDTDARLVSLAEVERSAARDAVADFRAALGELRVAAANSDVSAVRANYARAVASYRHLDETVGPRE